MNKFAKQTLHKKGKIFYSGLLPKEVPRGRVGDCFDHCIQVAMKFPKYKYVEGKVLVGKRWIYHAWLTDGILAFDPTWKSVTDNGEETSLFMMHYFGVEMDTKNVAEFMLKTKYKAVLKNYYRNPKLAKACITE